MLHISILRVIIRVETTKSNAVEYLFIYSGLIVTVLEICSIM